jgi:hypothetical protein
VVNQVLKEVGGTAVQTTPSPTQQPSVSPPAITKPTTQDQSPTAKQSAGNLSISGDANELPPIAEIN